MSRIGNGRSKNLNRLLQRFQLLILRVATISFGTLENIQKNHGPTVSHWEDFSYSEATTGSH
ncbi:hypothetical protein CHS0354_041107 [Potamilus streckersoni]|uniref:Uncharacterized protein n=1 Tax=Potamilus streckersoni TaxID=2493646 RepID=A0AAE0VTI3_9BIVA|nr:hypothetical protein CHS0354_041107 [Potamilus streckersoni]